MSKCHPSLSRFERDLRARNLSPRTVESYVAGVQSFIAWLDVPPSRARERDVRNYLAELLVDHKPTTVNHRATALRRFYAETLHKPEVVARVRRLKQERPLPTVLSGREVQRLLEATRSSKYRALILLMYGMGLRVSEACAVRVEDIDSERMMLRIPKCKADPRSVPLPKPVLCGLRDYWREVRPCGPALFSGVRSSGTLSPKTVGRALKAIAARAGIDKPVSPHVLRHSYATHLLDLGTDVRTVQVLLGHASIDSTMLYARMSRAQLTKTPSPVEVLGTKAGRVFG